MRNPTPPRRALNTSIVALIAFGLLLGAVAANAEAASKKPRGYVIVYAEKGWVACDAGAAGVVVEFPCLQPDGGNKHAYLAPAGSRLAFLEIQWQTSQALGGQTLAVHTSPALGEKGEATYSGKSILQAGVKSRDPAGTAEDAKVPATITAAGDSGIVLQQSYEIRASVFVNTVAPWEP